MSNLSNLNLLTVDLFNRWRLLLGELISSDLENLSVEKIDGLKDLYNKLALTVLTQERYLLAVTGLQGAGKTTLIKRLYNLDDQYLRDNDGRGENRPILITESEVSEPVGYVSRSEYSVEKGFVIKSEIIAPDEFNRIAKSPKKEEIWLELKVPYLHFNDEKKSLILLPGFEKDRDELSQQLLEHVLYLSTSSVVVFRKDTFARANNIEMIDRVKRIYENVKPIYVITHGDVNPENNEQIMKQFIDLVAQDNEDSDRIIMTGDPSLFKKDWIQEVVNKIGKYAFLTYESEAKKVVLLETLFGQVRSEIEFLENLLRKMEDKAVLNGQGSFVRDTNRIVRQFENMYEDTLINLEEQIQASLETRKKPAKEKLKKNIINNEGFWKNPLVIFSSTLEKEEKFKEAIEEAWFSAKEIEIEREVINVVTEVIEGKSNLLKNPIVDEKEESFFKKKNVNRFKLTGLEGNEEPTMKKGQTVQIIDSDKPITLAAAKKMKSIDRIEAFFSKNRKKADVIPLYRDDLKTLTIMGTMLFREGLYERALWEINSTSLGSPEALAFNSVNDLNAMPLEKSISDINNFTEKVSEFTPRILKAIPLILGADLVLDGEADLVVHATTALTGIGLDITALQLLGFIGGTVAVVYGVNAVKKAVEETNQRQLKLARAGEFVINQIPEIQAKAYVSSLRKVFERMADHLADVHKERLGVYDSESQIDEIRYSLRRIKLVNNQLQKMVYEYAPIII